MRSRPKVFYWILGAAIALTGVAVARLLSPQLPEAYQSVGFFTGTTIAVVGIFVVALGASAATGKNESQNTGTDADNTPSK